MPLVPHNSTELYPEGWSMLTELFGHYPVCRHETCPVTIFHITFYFPGWVCAVLQIGYSSVAGLSSRRTRFTTVSVHVGFVVKKVTLDLVYPPTPTPIKSVCPTQYHSATGVSLCLTHLPQKLYNLMIFRCLSSSTLVSHVFSFCDVIEKLSGVETSSVAL